MGSTLERARSRGEWRFFALLPRANRLLAAAWFVLLGLRALLPAAFAVVMGVLVRAVEEGRPLGGPLVAAGVVIAGLQVLAPLHAVVGRNLGDCLSSHLNERLLASATEPPGMAHLERPDLTNDMTMARDFDLGIMGPPMRTSMGFIAAGLGELLAGLASALVLFAYRWWAPLLLLAAWGSTHWLLRESAIWKERNTDEVQDAQRQAEYTYRLAVDPPAAKEMRLFGLADWTVDRFAARRRRLVDLRWEATKLKQRPVRWALAIVLSANLLVFWALAADAAAGRVGLGQVVTFAAAALGAHSVAFGGLNWALTLGAAPVVDAVIRLDGTMRESGALAAPAARAGAAAPPSAERMPAHEIRFRDVTFAYPTGGGPPVLEGFDLSIPAGSSLAIVGQNGAGKTTLAKLLCRLYDPQGGAIEVDGVDIRELDLHSWRARITAVFQDYVKYELPLRDNVVPRRDGAATDDVVRAALADAGGSHLADLDTILAKGYPGGVDLSGGQWQRVAIARALAAVRLGAGVVILDEPTAQLDVRGEAEIFERVLAATRHVTTIVVSHRFSTVRHADRICVLEHGRVVELGTHAELMELGGRYRTMFDLQAQRFAAGEEEEEDVVPLG